MIYVTNRLLNRFSSAEPMWDFLPEEAISVFAGRDGIGKKMTLTPPADPTMQKGILRACAWMSLVIALGISSWLAAAEIVSSAATAAVALISFWSVSALGRFVVQGAAKNPLTEGLATSVTRLRLEPASDSEPATAGLKVEGLSVLNANRSPILSDVRFSIEPGQVLGVVGPPGAGKSCLLQAIVGPYDLMDLDVRGSVKVGETDLWERSVKPASVSAILFPPTPVILPTSGHNKLSFFTAGPLLEQGKRILEQMVFASDAVERICNSRDATLLSGSEKKALAFSRGFLMSPQVYLVDRPEDGVTEKLMGAMIARVRQECRAGRSFVVVTENRALLDACDKLLMLQEGRVVDFGPAEEIRARQSSGWQRFVGSRSLETEENLETWVRSHFKRDGDEINRRNACVIAAELLALSCQSSSPVSHQSISFDFKHFEGHCLIKVTDQDTPLSTGVLQRAQNEADNSDSRTRLSPLATVFSLCSNVETSVEQDLRVIVAQLDTYDPRKTGGKPPESVLRADKQTKVEDDATGA